MAHRAGHCSEHHQVLHGCVDPGSHRRRLWRYRHERAVCRERGFWLRPRSLHPGQRVRHPVHPFLDADGHCLAQVRGAGAARRQPWRGGSGGHAGTGVPVGERPAPVARRPACGGNFRHLAVLWRRRHHAGDFGAVGGGGAGGGVAALQAVCASTDLAGLVLPVCRAETGHGRYRPILWPHHAGVDALDCPAGGRADRAPPGDSGRAQPALRPGLSVDPAGHQLHHPGGRGAVRDGRRSVVRRPGTFRQAAHPYRVVHGGHACAGAQLFWPGGAAAG